MNEQTKKSEDAVEPVVETGELSTADLEQAAGGVGVVIAKTDKHINSLCDNEVIAGTFKF